MIFFNQAILGFLLQVIVSGLSSPGVLTLDGVTNFARAIGLYVSHPPSCRAECCLI